MYSDQMDFLLSIHFLSDSEKTRLRERMKERVERVRALHNTAGDDSAAQDISEMRKNSTQDTQAIVPEPYQDSAVENMLTQELFQLLQGKNTEDVLSVKSLEEKVAEQLDIRTKAKTDNLEDIKPGTQHVDIETRTKAVFVKCRVCLKKVRKDMLERHKRVKHNVTRLNEKIRPNTTNVNQQVKVRNNRSKIVQNIKEEVVENAEASELLSTTKATDDYSQQKEKPAENIPYCSTCDIKFKFRKYYLKHNTKFHRYRKQGIKAEQFEFACSMCSKTFLSEKFLKKHLVRKHNQKKILKKTVTFKCQLCSDYFMTAALLDFHKSNKHNATIINNRSKNKAIAETNQSNNNKACTLCKKKFSRKHVLDTHKSTIHKDELHLFTQERYEGDEKYACKKCHETFLSEKVLNHHVLYHPIHLHDPKTNSKAQRRQDNSVQKRKTNAKEKPYPVDDPKPSVKCDHCSLVMSYKNNSNMKRHMSRMHPTIEINV